MVTYYSDGASHTITTASGPIVVNNGTSVEWDIVPFTVPALPPPHDPPSPGAWVLGAGSVLSLDGGSVRGTQRGYSFDDTSGDWRAGADGIRLEAGGQLNCVIGGGVAGEARGLAGIAGLGAGLVHIEDG